MERQSLVRKYMDLGLHRETCLAIVGLSKNQLYYALTGKKGGRVPTHQTLWRNPEDFLHYKVDNPVLMQRVVSLKLDSDYPNGYRLLTKQLQLEGYYINHKKVYRLMLDYCLLEEARRRKGRNFVKFRRVAPERPLEVLEMDIKYVWVHQDRKYAFILTLIDTFTRYVLHWKVGFRMRSQQVKSLWEYAIANYFQPWGRPKEGLQIEVRSDNGKQFHSKMILDFFQENELNQVFTHPYTPEENAHIESFHKTLGQALGKDVFLSLSELEERLIRFYTVYNNERCHGSLKGIPPAIFWALYDLNLVEVIRLEKRKIQLKLNVKSQDIMTLKGKDRYLYLYPESNK